MARAWMYCGLALASCLTAQPGGNDCAPCHAEIANTFRKTGMSRSFYRLTPSTAVEDFTGKPFYHAPSDAYFAMIERGGKYYQRRWQIGFDGKETSIEEKQVDFVLGSGNHGRTYLHLTDRSTLQQLPLGWYSGLPAAGPAAEERQRKLQGSAPRESGAAEDFGLKSGYWAMNPGYDRPDYPGSTRLIGYECMSCHNAYPRIPAGHQEWGAEAKYVEPIPEGIDCQRCHGPGQRHIEAAGRAGTKPEEIRAAIVNPKRLGPEREMEVCMQCHLETTSVALPHSIQRLNRGPFDYVPGQPLGDFRISFDRAGPKPPAAGQAASERSRKSGPSLPREPGAESSGQHNRFEVAHGAYRFRQSKCFVQSAGRLRCTTCHNPHDIPRGEAAISHYNQVCRDCHAAPAQRSAQAAAHRPGADCVSCHMPKRRTDDAVHVVMTDHRIQRLKPAQDLLAEKAETRDSPATAYRGEVVPYYPERLAPTTENALYIALAQIRDASNLKLGLPRLASLLETHRPARAAYYSDLAEGYRTAGDLPKAIRYYDEALQRSPASTPVLLRLGNALIESRQWAKAEAALRRATTLADDDPLAWGLLGWALWQQDRAAEAKAALEKGLKLNPDLPELHNYLASLLLGTGDRDGAEKEFREALRIEPGIAEWQANLATLLASRGEMAEARYRFEQSIRSKPDDAVTRLDYARFLAGMSQNAEAEKQAKAAVAADARSAGAHEFLGFLLAARGDIDGGGRELQAAVKLQPEFWRAQFEWGAVLWRQGDAKAAMEHLTIAANGKDPEARAAAEQLLKSLRR